MKILDWFFNKKEIKNQHNPIPKTNSITFSIDPWNRCTIDVSMFNPQEEISSEFGKMLYALNSGLYEQKILDCFVKLSNDYPFLKKNIQATLSSWAATIISDDNKTNSSHPLDGKPIPYIKPSLVFHKNH